MGSKGVGANVIRTVSFSVSLAWLIARESFVHANRPVPEMLSPVVAFADQVSSWFGGLNR